MPILWFVAWVAFWTGLMTAASAQTVKDFGAIGNDVADDTAAFQATIDASCPGHQSGAVSQVFPVVIPPGTYRISELNATNCNGFAMIGQGSGALAPILRGIASPNAFIDMTGSGAGFNLKNFTVFVGLSDGGPYANIGILIAPSAAEPNTGNYGEIQNVSVTGRFEQAAWYIYGICCSRAGMLGGMQAHPNHPNAFAAIITATNLYNAYSRFTSIATGWRGVSDWLCERCELHAFTSSATQSGKALYLDWTVNFTYINGQLAAANGFIVQANGLVKSTVFINTNFYTDQGPIATHAIGSVSFAHIVGLLMLAPNLNLVPDSPAVISNGIVSGMIIGGASLNGASTAGLGLL